MIRDYLFVDYATQIYILVVGLLCLFFHNQTVPAWGWLVAAHAALGVLVHLLIRSHGRGRGGAVRDFLRHFYPVLLYTAFYRESGMLSQMFVSGYLDPEVIRWEQALCGSQPSVLFMAALPWRWVSEIFYASYFSYYVMIAGIGLALFPRRREPFFHYVSVLSFMFYVCYLIYIFVPVIGPRVFFRPVGGFSLPPEIQQLAVTNVYPSEVTQGLFFRIMSLIYDVFEAPGAALPSSHVAVAVGTLWFSFRYLPRIRIVHSVVVVLLCLATVYCRYHYLVDVLAGLMTAAVLLPLGNWLFRRYHQPPAPAPAGGRGTSLRVKPDVR